MRLRIKLLSVIIQIKAIEQFVPVVMCMILQRVVLTFENETFKCTIQMTDIKQYTRWF